MKKLTSNFSNMAVVLTVICLLAALLLSFFFDLTKGKIEEADKKKQEFAIAEVLPFSNMEIKTEKAPKVEKEENLPEDMVKSTQDDIQKLTDKYVGIVDSLVVEKEKEVMTV